MMNNKMLSIVFIGILFLSATVGANKPQYYHSEWTQIGPGELVVFNHRLGGIPSDINISVAVSRLNVPTNAVPYLDAPGHCIRIEGVYFDNMQVMNKCNSQYEYIRVDAVLFP